MDNIVPFTQDYMRAAQGNNIIYPLTFFDEVFFTSI